MSQDIYITFPRNRISVKNIFKYIYVCIFMFIISLFTSQYVFIIFLSLYFLISIYHVAIDMNLYFFKYKDIKNKKVNVFYTERKRKYIVNKLYLSVLSYTIPSYILMICLFVFLFYKIIVGIDFINYAVLSGIFIGARSITDYYIIKEIFNIHKTIDYYNSSNHLNEFKK